MQTKHDEYDMTTLQMNAQIQQNLAIIQKDEGMTEQLLRYMQQLVKKLQSKEKATEEKKHFALQDYCGILDTQGKTDRELIDEYLEEKYGV